MFAGLYGYLIAAGGAFVFGGALVGWGVHAIDNGAYQSLKAENATQIAAANAAALKQVEAWASQMHDAALAYTNSQTVLNDQIDTIQSELRNVKTRLPAGCKPDADRLHLIQSAVAASNAATPRP